MIDSHNKYITDHYKYSDLKDVNSSDNYRLYWGNELSKEMFSYRLITTLNNVILLFIKNEYTVLSCNFMIDRVIIPAIHLDSNVKEINIPITEKMLNVKTDWVREKTCENIGHTIIKNNYKLSEKSLPDVPFDVKKYIIYSGIKFICEKTVKLNLNVNDELCGSNLIVNEENKCLKFKCVLTYDDLKKLDYYNYYGDKFYYNIERKQFVERTDCEMDEYIDDQYNDPYKPTNSNSHVLCGDADKIYKLYMDIIKRRLTLLN